MMSGTSLDGLDLALVKLQQKGQEWSYSFIATDCLKYTSEKREQLAHAIELPAPELLALHAEYGSWLGKKAGQFLRTHKASVDAIASHGHTIHHRPEAGFTFQLGCPQQVALSSGFKTVGDFRTLDVALGGQGAPLVPVGDELLFGDFDFCLNLGGISNLSFCKNEQRIAFDVGIANMLLNHICRNNGLSFDKGGDLARGGRTNPELLQALDGLAFYKKPYPKSTGYEWFRDKMLPLLQAFPDSLENQLHTGVLHIAGQIAHQLQALSVGKTRVLVTGGGALNTFLIETLEAACGRLIEIVCPKDQLIDYKEALVFALLGALRLEGKTNVLASVTGARRDSCSGVIYLPE
jgi:anhydro-N-acetylmuramic acid kinase